MLPYYAERFSTVEINYTFYRMPTAKLVAGWAARPPSTYKLTLKAPKRITHDQRLREVRPTSCAGFCEAAATLGPQARRAAVPARAELQEGPRGLRRVPRGAAAARLRRLRIPSRFVARRRGLRPVARAQSGVVHRRQREAIDAGDGDRGLCLPALRDEGYTPEDIAAWADRIARDCRRSAARSTSTSSTRTQGRDPSSAACSRSVSPADTIRVGRP